MTAAARIDDTARAVLEAIDRFVRELGADKMRCGMQRSEVDKGLHAVAVLEAMHPKLAILALARDMLARALNTARLDAPHTLSMDTLGPATFDRPKIPEWGQSTAPDLSQPSPRSMTVHLIGRFTAAGLRGIADALDEGRSPGDGTESNDRCPCAPSLVQDTDGL